MLARPYLILLMVVFSDLRIDPLQTAAPNDSSPPPFLLLKMGEAGLPLPHLQGVGAF